MCGGRLAPVAAPWFFCEVISLMALSETPVGTLCAPSHFFLRLCVLVWRDGCHVAGIQFWQHPTVSSYSLLLRRFEVHWKSQLVKAWSSDALHKHHVTCHMF